MIKLFRENIGMTITLITFGISIVGMIFAMGMLWATFEPVPELIKENNKLLTKLTRNQRDTCLTMKSILNDSARGRYKLECGDTGEIDVEFRSLRGRRIHEKVLQEYATSTPDPLKDPENTEP